MKSIVIGLVSALMLSIGPIGLGHTYPLPLGDGKISQTPKVGYVFSCRTSFFGGGAHRRGEWIKANTWDPADKPRVDGQIMWPGSSITVSVVGDKRVVRANNLPKHATGQFPISPIDDAYQYDRNPNSIEEQDIILILPAVPSMARVPTCVPMGMIGFALTGVAIYNALDARGRDAPAHEIQDSCNGQTTWSTKPSSRINRLGNKNVPLVQKIWSYLTVFILMKSCSLRYGTLFSVASRSPLSK